METLDVLVIGTGRAASTVISKCAKAGRSVAVVDERPFGGTCALRGCNPKKVLVRAAELSDHYARQHHLFTAPGSATLDWGELIRFKRQFTDPVVESTEKKYARLGVRVFHGHAEFTGPQQMRIGEHEIEAGQIVLAAGAVPRKLEIPGDDLLTQSDDFMELDELPRKIAFIGGGYVSTEFAHVAVRAGAAVQVFHRGARILQRFEPELVERLVKRSRTAGIEIQTKAEVKAIRRTLEGPLTLDIEADGQKHTYGVDLVVHGAGRVPNLGFIRDFRGTRLGS